MCNGKYNDIIAQSVKFFESKTFSHNFRSRSKRVQDFMFVPLTILEQFSENSMGRKWDEKKIMKGKRCAFDIVKA